MYLKAMSYNFLDGDDDDDDDEVLRQSSRAINGPIGSPQSDPAQPVEQELCGGPQVTKVLKATSIQDFKAKDPIKPNFLH